MTCEFGPLQKSERGAVSGGVHCSVGIHKSNEIAVQYTIYWFPTLPASTAKMLDCFNGDYPDPLCVNITEDGGPSCFSVAVLPSVVSKQIRMARAWILQRTLSWRADPWY